MKSDIEKTVDRWGLRAFVAAIVLILIVSWFIPTPHVRAQQGAVALGANGFNCVVTISTATTIQAVGGSCVAPGANLRLYITDIEANTNAGAIAADTFLTLKSGTGGTCGAATAVVWQAMTPAATQANVSSNLTVPIRLPLNNELCWINSTVGSKAWQIHGFIAP